MTLVVDDPVTASEHTLVRDTPADHVVHYSQLVDTNLHRPFCTCGWTTESLAPLLMCRDAVHVHWQQMEARRAAHAQHITEETPS